MAARRDTAPSPWPRHGCGSRPASCRRRARRASPAFGIRRRAARRLIGPADEDAQSVRSVGDLDHPRWLQVLPNGDGVAGTRSVLLSGLHSPFGMALIGDRLFVASADAVLAFPYRRGDTVIKAPGTKLLDLPGGMLQAAFADGMFIGQHGSWNRRPHSGCKVIFVPFQGGRPTGAPSDVLSGFLSQAREAMGRAVGVAVDARGALLVADDVGIVIWRVSALP